MADLDTACCTTEGRCCEPEQKADCCGAPTEAGGCGCDAGQQPPADAGDIRETVRRRYAAAATAVRDCGCGTSLSEADETGVFGAELYDAPSRADAGPALELSLGCGNPTSIAELNKGETVLDLGSGAGGDVLLSARRVGPSGKTYGLDMTDEMVELACKNAREAGLDNVEFLKGYIEQIPLPDDTVDVVISNCVINLSGDKQQVLSEAARVLRPGGRFAVSDVIADESMEDATRRDMQQWTGCIAGALTRREFEDQLAAAGLADIEIQETHRVHEHAGSAIVRARKPAAEACCDTAALDECCEPAAKSDCCGADAADTSQAPASCGCR
jgi:arsenite methyltransferase